MKTTKRVVPILFIVMIVAAFLFGLRPGATEAGASGPDAALPLVQYSVTASGNTFTISRTLKSGQGVLPRQLAIVRTVDLTAIGGVHYEPVYETLLFNEGEKSKSITVTEYTSDQIGNLIHRYQNGNSREYRFEALDDQGFILASVKRQISYSSYYTFNNRWIMEHSGEGLLCLDSNSFASLYPPLLYDNDPYVDVSFPDTSSYTVIDDKKDNGYTQGVWTVLTRDLFLRTNCASRDYLEAIGDSIYASIGFIAQEIDNGYQYIQILADNAETCDGKDSDGSVNTPSISLYKACFELAGTGGGDATEYRMFFPHKNNTASEPLYQGIDYTELYGSTLLSEQKFKNDSYRAENAGALVLSPTTQTISVRFNARGSGNDDWQFKNMFARLAIVDVKKPELVNVSMSRGRNAKRNRVTVTFIFSEIVIPDNCSIDTSWGRLYAESTSTYANTVSFSGTITANAGTEFAISNVNGEISDLQGNTFVSPFPKPMQTFTVGESYAPEFDNGSYVLSTPSDVYWFADFAASQPNASAILKNDIDMISSETSDFTPICPNGFAGTFDGKSHRLLNLTVKQSGSGNTGLFSSIASGGVVRNLELDESCKTNAWTAANVGSIAGQNAGTIERCIVGGSVYANDSKSGSGKSVGGICGLNVGTVRDCLFGSETLFFAFDSFINNKWTNTTAGGVVGKNVGTVQSCMFYSLYYDTQKDSNVIGAVCGRNEGSIVNSAGLGQTFENFGKGIGETTGTEKGVFYFAFTAFESGQVCYLLNDGVTDGTQAWYQVLSVDTLPKLSGDPAVGTVYMHGPNFVNEIVHTWSSHTYSWTWNAGNARYDVCAETSCSVCDEAHSENAHGTLSVRTDPTCTEPGNNRYEANFIGAEYGFTTQYKDDPIAALGHTPGEWAVTNEPTCTEKGRKCRMCSVCGGETDETEEIAALGHDWGDSSYSWTDENTAAEASHRCLRCSATESEEASSEVEKIEPTCVTPGEYIYTVVFSNPTFTKQTKTRDIEAGHDMETVAAVAATCTQSGSIFHYHCVKCGKDFEDEIGMNELSADQIIIDPLGHNMSFRAEKDPTCLDDGNYEHYFCSRCGEYFSDTNGENGISADSVLISRLGHDYVFHAKVDPTCTTNGTEAYYDCSRCGGLFDEDKDPITAQDLIITAPGHSITQHFTVREVGCENYGCTVECYLCGVCGKYFTDENYTEEIAKADAIQDPLGHDSETVAAKDATCLLDGNVEYVHCRRCGKEWIKNENEELILASDEQIVIPALGHAPSDWTVTKEPTCTEAGSKHKTCTVCGIETEAQEIAVLEHTPGEWVVTKEPTCTEAGSKHKTCTVCGIETETQDIRANGHSFSDWEILSGPNSKKPGKKHRVCSVCEKCEEADVELTEAMRAFVENYNKIDLENGEVEQDDFDAIGQSFICYRKLTEQEKEWLAEEHENLMRYVREYNRLAEEVNKDVAEAAKSAFSLFAALATVCSALWLALKKLL